MSAHSQNKEKFALEKFGGYYFNHLNKVLSTEVSNQGTARGMKISLKFPFTYFKSQLSVSHPSPSHLHWHDISSYWQLAIMTRDALETHLLKMLCHNMHGKY